MFGFSWYSCLIFSTNKTDHHLIKEILLKVSLNTHGYNTRFCQSNFLSLFCNFILKLNAIGRNILLIISDDRDLLPSNVTHYIIPDCQIAREYLEIFEVPEINGIIFTQTAEHSVSENI